MGAQQSETGEHSVPDTRDLPEGHVVVVTGILKNGIAAHVIRKKGLSIKRLQKFAQGRLVVVSS